MNHDVTAIDQHPLARLFALDAIDPATVFFDFIHDVFGQSFGLPRGISAGNGNVVKNGSELGNVDEFDVARFDVFKRVDDDGRQFLGSQLKFSPLGRRACGTQYNRKRRQVLNRVSIDDFSADRGYPWRKPTVQQLPAMRTCRKANAKARTPRFADWREALSTRCLQFSLDVVGLGAALPQNWRL